METGIAKSTIKKTSLGNSHRFLLICGILSSVLYVVMNIIAPVNYPGYDPVSQTVSELSAIDAPTRSLWVPLGFVYTLLVAFFGWGIWQSAEHNRYLRIGGALLLTYGLIGLGWPPMHQREVLAAGGGTFTDTMHIVYSMVTVLLMLLTMWFTSKGLDKHFHYYSVVSVSMLIILGTWTGLQAPRLQQNMPTPWLGLVERVLIFIFLVWIVVLAIILLKTKNGNHKPSGEKSKEFIGSGKRDKIVG